MHTPRGWKAPTSPHPYDSHPSGSSLRVFEHLKARPWYTICCSPCSMESRPTNGVGAPLTCLGCRTLVGQHHGNNANPPRVLCDECRRFAKLAPYGTRCRQCRSDDVVYTTERSG